MESFIYTITAMNPAADRPLDSPRAFGFFHNKEDALRAVDENRGSMSESFYTYLVVEAIRPGIHAISGEEIWFEWNDQTNHWDACEKPIAVKGSICFAMG